MDPKKAMKRIAILGSTGSIGQSALALLRSRRDRFRVVLLAANRAADRLYAQALAFGTRRLALAGFERREEALPPPELPGGSPRLFLGARGILDALEDAGPDLVLNAITGSAGLRASAWTLEQGRTLLLANKESLVTAGPLLRRLQDRNGAGILPVDSEHAAIHQCLRGERRRDLRRIYLTASGGPFRDLSREEMARATREEALAHPTWKMGERITIGSATMMNKAFEVIEAHHLFGLAPEEIEILVHRQSILHSLVEFRDGSIMAQCGVPDMRVPILYCLGWPERLDFDFQGFDLERFSRLTFEEVDFERFPALRLGYEVVRSGRDSGAVLNAADEVATRAFLDGRIPFPRIVETAERVLEKHEPRPIGSVDQVLEVDAWARREACLCLQ